MINAFTFLDVLLGPPSEFYDTSLKLMFRTVISYHVIYQKSEEDVSKIVFSCCQHFYAETLIFYWKSK